MNCVSYYQQNVNKLFYDNEARLRSGWRALAFLFSYLFVSGLFIKAFILFRGEADTEKPADLLSLAIPYTIATLIAVILGWGYGRWFESVGLDAVGVALSGRSLRNLALGLGIGALAIGFAVLVAVATSSMSLTLNRGSAGSAIAYNLATTLVVFVTGAASEETLFRG